MSTPGPARPVGADFSSRLGGDALLVITGELDLATRPRLRQSVDDVLRLAPARVVVDLAGVTFFDVGTVNEFVRARSAVRAAGGDLVLRSPSALVRRVLGIVGLADLVEADSTSSVAIDEALGSSPRLADVAAAWEAACLTRRYGSAALVFDPSFVTTAIDALLRDHDVMTGTDASDEISRAVSMQAGTSPVVAVMQLWALNDVLHAWMDPTWGVDLAPGHPYRRRLSLEAALAGVAATVLIDLERSSLVDPLTGLLNRRALDSDILEALAFARRNGQSLTVVMVDVEGLKAANDRFGHAAGDALLRQVATCLTSEVRSGDNVYRIGGDEYVLLLPDRAPVDVEAVMRRTAVGAPISFTWGFAWVADDDDDDVTDVVRAERLLEVADRRMLASRIRSRNGLRDRRVGDVAPASPQHRMDLHDIVAGEMAAGVRARVVIDGAKGVIAEGFEIGIEEASAIIRQVSLARNQTVLAVAEGLMARADDGRVPEHPAGAPVAARDEAEPVVASSAES